MDRSCTAAKSGVYPISPAHDNVVEHSGVVHEGVFTDSDFSEYLLNKPPHPETWRTYLCLQEILKTSAFRKVVKPLRCLHEGNVRIPKVAKRVFQQRRKRAGVCIADDNEVAAGLLHGVAQISCLEPDVVITRDVTGAFFLCHLAH